MMFFSATSISSATTAVRLESGKSWARGCLLRANATDSIYCAGRVEVPPAQLLVLKQGRSTK